VRSLLVLVAASTFGAFAACNETVGECWYYGEGTENAAAGVGPLTTRLGGYVHGVLRAGRRLVPWGEEAQRNERPGAAL
jgi:hypothetical protein